MPLDVGELVNSAANTVLKAPFIRAVASNPIYTAMIIVFIMMLVIMIVFRDTKSENSILIMTLRSGFWMFLATLGIIFMHNKILSAEHEESEKTGSYDDVFEESSPHSLEPSVPIRNNISQYESITIDSNAHGNSGTHAHGNMHTGTASTTSRSLAATPTTNITINVPTAQ